MTTQMSLVVLLVIILIFSDWLSRVRLPWQLPPSDVMGIGNQLAKTILEVGGLYFLVLACLSAIGAHSPDLNINTSGHPDPESEAGFWATALSPEKPFAFFLFLTFIWNLFILRVMRQLRWQDLARVGLNGKALDLENAEVYAKRFWQLRERLEKSVADKMGVGAEKTLNNLRIASGPALLEGSVRAGAQIVAIHIAWASVCACFILIGDVVLQQPVANAIKDDLILRGRTDHVLLFLFSFFLISLFIITLERGETRKNWLSHTIVTCIIIFIATWLSFWLSPSSNISAALYWLIGLLVIPTTCFFIASLSSKGGGARKHILWFGGTVTAVVMLLLYMRTEPKTLMIIVAFEQVLVNAFLQYAASERSITVTVNPQKVAILRGSTQEFTATVTGTPEKRVMWGVTAGIIADNGVYTAPLTPGVFKVCATSRADQNRFAEATVTVLDKLPAPEPTNVQPGQQEENTT
jgi:hypothetical protein